jgi:hypothetical protein
MKSTNLSRIILVMGEIVKLKHKEDRYDEKWICYTDHAKTEAFAHFVNARRIYMRAYTK